MYQGKLEKARAVQKAYDYALLADDELLEFSCQPFCPL